MPNYQLLSRFLQDFANETALNLLSDTVCLKMPTLFLDLDTSVSSPSLFIIDTVQVYASIDLSKGLNTDVNIHLVITKMMKCPHFILAMCNLKRVAKFTRPLTVKTFSPAIFLYYVKPCKF